MAAVRFMEERGSPSACFCLVHGEPGVGKTRNISHYGAANGTVLVKGHAGMTLAGLRWAVSQKLGVKHHRNSTEEIEEQIEAIKEGGVVIVFDEAQFGLAMQEKKVKAAGIEYLRDIAERGSSYVLLVCHNSEVSGFSESKHIRTRIAHRCELFDADEKDTAAFVKDLCEVEVTAEVAALVHKQTGGKYRLVENAIAALERIAKMKGVTKLDIDAVANITLVVDHEQTLVPKVAPKKPSRR
ncbi:MAG: AAA family ATPase [Candidatus Bathyarchaeota archaeon]